MSVRPVTQAAVLGYSDRPDLATSHGDNVSQPKPDIPGYRILRRLGHGGMSEIWLAEQVALARPVAIKIVSLGQEADARLARFRQEASLIARFDHPNVVGIIEFGDTGDGRLYFSMPYVPNGTLAEAGLRGDVPRMREVIAQVLDALAYVHRHGVVHRDVKPENVLFDNVGRARLADFGVSRSMEGGSRHTRVGETFGSSYYLSPEQARGEPLDGRSDLYSVGAVTYELLTGTTPFHGPDDLSIVIAHLQAPVPKLPPELRHWQPWIDTALAKRADHRFADADAMRAAMDRIPETAAGTGWSLRRHVPIAVAALALVAAIIFVLITRPFADRDEMTPVLPQARQDAVAALGMEALPESSSDATSSNGSMDTDVSSSVPGDMSVPIVPEADPLATGSTVSPATTAGLEPTIETPSPDHQLPNAANDSPVTTAAAPDAVSAPRRVAPRAAPPPAARPAPPSFATSFQSVPRIPLYLLAGTREEQLNRIDEHLEWGRRAIEADRADIEALRRDTGDREMRKRLRDGYDARKSNHETWRRQLLELRRKVERSE